MISIVTSGDNYTDQDILYSQESKYYMETDNGETIDDVIDLLIKVLKDLTYSEETIKAGFERYLEKIIDYENIDNFPDNYVGE